MKRILSTLFLKKFEIRDNISKSADNIFEVKKMKYNGIKDLLTNEISAKEYFNTLSNEVQEALTAHGDGINTLEELKHFAQVIREQG